MQLSQPNIITSRADDTYISYNPVDHWIYGCDTTAIVTRQMTRFYILCGDHTDALNAALKAGGLQACLDYFSAQPDDVRHKMSDPMSTRSINEDCLACEG